MAIMEVTCSAPCAPPVRIACATGAGLGGHDFHAFIDGVILVVDPFAEEGLRREIEMAGAPAPTQRYADAHYVLGRMIDRFLFGQKAKRLELLNLAVIPRQLLQVPLAAQIQSAVARPQIAAVAIACE